MAEHCAPYLGPDVDDGDVPTELNIDYMDILTYINKIYNIHMDYCPAELGSIGYLFKPSGQKLPLHLRVYVRYVFMACEDPESDTKASFGVQLRCII